MDSETPYPVISLLEEQLGVVNKGGTMRLGAYPCQLVPGTVAARAYPTEAVSERHRHRLEFNNRFRGLLEGKGLAVSGASPDGSLVEIGELAGHPFMLGTQFHPELQSRPNRPHPLFREFVAAAMRRGEASGRSGFVAASEAATTS
jgi:CTP synthase